MTWTQGDCNLVIKSQDQEDLIVNTFLAMTSNFYQGK